MIAVIVTVNESIRRTRHLDGAPADAESRGLEPEVYLFRLVARRLYRSGLNITRHFLPRRRVDLVHNEFPTLCILNQPSNVYSG